MSAYRIEPAYTFGKLLFKGGAGNLTLTTDANVSGLVRGEFHGPKRPTFTEHDGTVDVKWPRLWPWHWSKVKSSIALREDVPWAIEFRGGVSRIRG